jgi:XTP/dITP diphosphohydrolase
LLSRLAGVPARDARFRTVICLAWPDGRLAFAEGECRGRIAGTASGSNGFGYDPVFVPDEGDGRTFAEMTPDEKHAISHRGRAVRAAVALLGGLVDDGR